MPLMSKPRHRPIEVADDLVDAYAAEGFQVCGGSAPAAPEPEDSGLSPAEIKEELAAIEKVVRKKGKEKGLKKIEIDADVEAEVSRAKIKLGVK